MARQKKPDQRAIEQYKHENQQRVNNPPVGLVTPDTDPDGDSKKYAYDPHLDPQLVWAGKAEHTSFEVPTVSLHVHERIDPRSIIEAVRKRNPNQGVQLSLFEQPEENPPIRQAIEFYKHKHNWSNRLVAGDSLLVMNSLLEKEGMAGQVQMIYFDPPYGIKYGSNFQPFVNKRDVKDGKDEDLTQEPETIKAFRDTWELGIHSYLSYLRDRLLLARELLSESGSVFVQISDENVHHVRELMDEVFGADNFCSLITFQKTAAVSSPQARTEVIGTLSDYLIWYSKDASLVKYNQLFLDKNVGIGAGTSYKNLIFSDGTNRSISSEELANPNLIPKDAKVYQATSLQSSGYSETLSKPFEFEDKKYSPLKNCHWKTTLEGLNNLAQQGRIIKSGTNIRYVRYLDDFPVSTLGNIWIDLMGATDKLYVVQTATKVIQRCLLMTTDPGDLVLDITCGSGTTAYVAEQWGRRWITCDTSRVAITLARQRLMTATFDYYQLANSQEGVGSGFKYKTVPHITLKSIANNPEIREGMNRIEIEQAINKYADEETLYDQPLIDKSRVRVTGPFTVEAVPAPIVKPIDDFINPPVADQSIARSGETLRQSEWRDEMLKTGIRGKNGQYILFSRVEALPGTRWLHADAETKPNDLGANTVKESGGTYDKPMRTVISFGPEHAPLEQRHVTQAIEEAQTLVPKPKLIIFAAFQFDPEAAKDIDETNWPGVTLLKAQMNMDMQTEDLKKKRASNDSFWLMGQPDVALRRINRGEDAGKWEVEVHGFDYYNTKTGNIESGSVEKIAVWMLDIDYDGRSVFPRQVFFPMAGEKDAWSRLARNLKAEIDEDLIESYQGTVSLPFEIGEYQRVAVKIVDDRGIESLKIIRLS
ncbi:MAG: site-specific DNA-methyltransferase [Oscillatoriales cyanobacterium]|uniref:site-specific DNA-methyltransferase n=1 Tax=Microcoleus sp. PH2017_05_CCC_O_A TaxID=2798816 RepID=UPI001E14DA38|nr:site-specific DNA-methyltransferase [Microcoleus sp. PH2017_05_CCC_O_A]MCC3434123.1 site-specific DNA-methyltransferase [Microcoleus sp. PH2017_05_CCC_O_A]TAG16283.1 MAG: site-specific DNA-methyltransferase [Oscillatoriales cyanobacterium]TAG44439.1 MAG: site-specific DNA-methyltransferase [Oscillatoriales cyanobacterium]